MELTNSQRDIWLVLGVVFAFLQVVIAILALSGSDATDTQRQRRRHAVRYFVRAMGFMLGYLVASSLVVLIMSKDIWLSNDQSALPLINVLVVAQLAIAWVYSVFIYFKVGAPKALEVLYGGFATSVLALGFVVGGRVPKTPSYGWNLTALYVKWANGFALLIALVSFMALSGGFLKHMNELLNERVDKSADETH